MKVTYELDFEDIVNKKKVMPGFYEGYYYSGETPIPIPRSGDIIDPAGSLFVVETVTYRYDYKDKEHIVVNVKVDCRPKKAE